MPPKTLEEIVYDTHAKVDKLYTVLLGEPGTDSKGLCGEVNYHRHEISTLKLKFWILVAILIGSGVIGGVLVRLF
jgi:hypothetical protein